MQQRDNSSDSETAPDARVAFVQSCWHRDLVDRCRDAFLVEMAKHGYSVDVYEVPGAFEIPLRAKLLAQTGRYAGVVGAALVVDGGIYRHEFVAEAVVGGLMRVQLDTDVPVFSAVLTPQQFHEHEDHRRFFSEHLVTKGTEVAQTCAATLQSLPLLRGVAHA